MPDRTVAALYIQSGGVYYDLPCVEPWGLPERDAREYAGPHPVVAHPPCQRWGNYWFGSPSSEQRFYLGADGGCFAAALWAVRTFGGILEHPEMSRAWPWFGLREPPRNGFWLPVNDGWGGWTCCVEQGHYGHDARKATWLYAVGLDSLPSLHWGPSRDKRPLENLSKRQRAATPIPFRDLLISIARQCGNQGADQ